MADYTYIEVFQNSKPTVQINAWNRDTGNPFYPSAAYYTVKGSRKENTLIPRTSATVNGNQVYTRITTTITASAAEYDVNWEIRKSGGDVQFHCTKLLVVEC
jgi:hypothetical protein